MSLKSIAVETLSIIEDGGYESPGGTWRTLGAEFEAARAGTGLYTPEMLEVLGRGGQGRAGAIDVIEGKTQAVARQLVQDDGIDDLVVLNFASAKNPGGGFISGARAQEEDLCRCSALYPCLETQRTYYEVNRAESSLLYTDHIIYSPGVPFFRQDTDDLLEEPFMASVITAPAPNAGEHLRRHPADGASVKEALRRRARYVLAVASDCGHRNLLLGAWGCGVFRNDPGMVADAFGDLLEESEGGFERVVFGIYDRARGQPNLTAFRARFES